MVAHSTRQAQAILANPPAPLDPLTTALHWHGGRPAPNMIDSLRAHRGANRGIIVLGAEPPRLHNMRPTITP